MTHPGIAEIVVMSKISMGVRKGSSVTSADATSSFDLTALEHKSHLTDERIEHGQRANGAVGGGRGGGRGGAGGGGDVGGGRGVLG